MSEFSLSQLMQGTTKALYECQESLNPGGRGITGQHGESLNADQTEHLLKLMESLVDTKIQLNQEIKADKVIHIDPNVVNEMQAAIEMAFSNPVDAKVNQIYFSIFGYNSALWQVLKEMQKLLKTVQLNQEKQGRRVVKVEKKLKERRKKRHENDPHGSDREDE